MLLKGLSIDRMGLSLNRIGILSGMLGVWDASYFLLHIAIMATYVTICKNGTISHSAQ